jgi:FtsH-binding integral membrane protein
MEDNQNYGTTSISHIPNNDDLEWQKANTKDEEDTIELNLRLGFVRKTLAIISMQLTITAISIGLSCSVPSLKNFQNNYPLLLGLLSIIGLITLIALTCCNKLSRKVPVNYILLFIFTTCEAYSVSSICIHYNPSVVMLAGGMTAAMSIGLMIYAMNTKKDFTLLGSILFIGLIALILFGIACLFCKSRVFEIIACVFGVVLFGIYLVYDIQLLIGDKERCIDMEDYIFGAVSVYMDIINIFIYLLRILGKEQN